MGFGTPPLRGGGGAVEGAELDGLRVMGGLGMVGPLEIGDGQGHAPKADEGARGEAELVACSLQEPPRRQVEWGDAVEVGGGAMGVDALLTTVSGALAGLGHAGRHLDRAFPSGTTVQRREVDRWQRQL